VAQLKNANGYTLSTSSKRSSIRSDIHYSIETQLMVRYLFFMWSYLYPYL